MKNLVFILAFTLCFAACKQEPSANSAVAEAPATTTDIPATSSSALENLKANAFEETDYIGRVRNLVGDLQAEYTRASGKVAGVGTVTVTVDDKYNLLIDNKLDGHTFTTKVNLKDLQHKDNGMSAIPDDETNQFPGLRISTLGAKPKVQHLKDGALVKETAYIEFFLADRAGVEKVVPSMFQAINIASGAAENQ